MDKAILNQTGVENPLLLYAVTDRHWLNGRILYDDVEEALKGGVTFVQLREKDDMAMAYDDFLAEAKEIGALCRKYQVPFVIDDNVEIALAAGADGVHVGQSDMEAGAVREAIGEDRILGVSAHTVEEALLAEKRGADYLGVGAVFPTGSKKDAESVDFETLRAICAAVKIPVVAIGGITRDNVRELAGSGICGISVISAIFAQEHIREASEALKEETRKIIEG
ncbi:thiamine phosphate synthase [Eubacterium pyruvativorans]|uniref:thiamine phosphate synthase n=1 Tax=Eubacterium pyruvativorans TaxID=155865 RepID=UPI00240957DA|nr:thiamine phosphate synthase [Eubacterium pyruvativorans]MDD6708134.1 thiamine phosphate synthase [Eubacterium pyruvativorans]